MTAECYECATAGGMAEHDGAKVSQCKGDDADCRR